MRFWQSIIVSLILISLLSSCGPTNVSYMPDATDDGWQVSAPATQGVSKEKLNVLFEELNTKKYPGISSVLLSRNNQLIFEAYFNDFSRDELHSTRSAAKAITSLLLGIAIDKHFVRSVNEPVLSYFPEYKGKIQHWDARKNDITLAHILSMTSGVKGNEDAMYPTDDWIKFYLDQPLAYDPGTRFSYATSGVVTLGSVITRSAKMRIPEFAEKYLFQPMNINELRWPITNSLGNQGLAMTGGGLNLRPRDMLKIGQLVLNQGEWQGKQLISKEWLAESTQKHSTSDLRGEDFGYLWRMITRNIGGTEIRSIEAWGNGGQFIMIFPSLDLVAVFTGENYGKFPEMEQPFQLIEQYILPAVL